MHSKITLLNLLLLAVLSCSQQLSTPSSPTYMAAVVEFAISTAPTPTERLQDATNRIRDFIESEEVDGVEIIVFPEHVLNVEQGQETFVPDPQDAIAPCEIPIGDYFLTTISCVARSRNLYVVINLVEKELCSADEYCDERGFNRYQTNVVFDRGGRVISRYRKTHLRGPEWYESNVVAQPQLATFTTDFGVTFGHFMCFDMLFYEPAQMLVKELNVTDIIYPTYWYSELPFLTAVQLQEGWAYGNDVNLLAAGASNPSDQNTGSGIYVGKYGRLTAAMHEEPVTRILKAEVPKAAYRHLWTMPVTENPIFEPKLESYRFSRLSLLRDYNVDIFSTLLLEADFREVTKQVCHGEFCCDFHLQRRFIVESRAHSAYRHRLVAYDGSNTTFQSYDPSDIAVCGVISCTNEHLYSCGHIYSDEVSVGNKFYFNAINVTGSFRQAEQRLIMPSTVDAQMMPLALNQYEMSQIEGESATWATITLSMPTTDLLTFGIYANYYSKKVATHNLNPAQLAWQTSAATLSSTVPEMSLLLLTLVALYFSHQ